MVYRKNLLSTEAHRHPYIETLGLMYLMKLRHRERFGSPSGSAWRLLFVAALMPWLKKKRIQDAFAPQVSKGTVGVADQVIGGLFAIGGN